MKYKVMIVEDQTMPRELFELRIQAFRERFEVAAVHRQRRAGGRILPALSRGSDSHGRGHARRREWAGRSGADQAYLPADENHHRDLHAGMLLPEPRARDWRGEFLVQGGAARKPAGRDDAHDGGQRRSCN